MSRRVAGRGFVALYAMLLSALPAAAYRLEFIARYQGARVAGAEVCFFPAGSDENDPTDFYLHAEDVRCYPADSVIQIPPGRWFHYVRHTARSLISSSPTLVTYDAPKSAPDMFGTNVIELEPAATLDLTAASADLNPDESFAIYASNEGTEQLPMIFPIPRGQSSAIVPASMSLLLIRREHRRVVAIGDSIRLAAGEHRSAPNVPKNPAGGTTFIAWTVFPADARKAEEPWRKVPAPDVRAVAGGIVRSPVPAPRPGFGSDGALMVFRGMPPGKVSVRAGGGIWSSAEQTFDSSGGGLALASRPLVIRPAAELHVRWNLRGNAAPQTKDCGGEKAPAVMSPAAVTLFSCEALQRGMTPDLIDPAGCSVVAKPAILDRTSRTASFDGVPSGIYVLVVNEPPLPAARKLVDVAVGDVQSIDVTLQAFRVFGKVVVDGQPVSARIEFAGGSTVSDSAGNYDVGLSKDPRGLPIHVRPCNDRESVRTHLPEKPLIENQPYDLVFVPNDLEIHVLDTTSHAPIPSATVTVGVLLDETSDAGEFLANVPSTDQTGRTTIRDVPSGRRLLACAEAPQFKRACTEPFTIEAKAHGAQVIALAAMRFRGVVAGTGPLRWGRVLFASSTGVLIENAYVQGDGSFSFRQPHRAPEYAVVVSDRPMFIADLPEAAEGTLTLVPPAGTVRNLNVSIDPRRPQKDAYVGLIIDGRYVPAVALSLHQGGRYLQGLILGRGPLLIPDILATRSVQVLLGPQPADPVIGSAGLTDVFTLPAYRATFPLRDADAEGHVSF